MAETFLTSDQHFGHARVLDLSERPFDSIEEHDEALIAHHNAMVRHDDDITWFLGDYALGDRDRGLGYLSRMRGRKFLVTGNHDACWPGTTGGYKHIARYMAAGFEVVVPYARIKLPPLRPGEAGQKVWLSHFPYDGDSHGADRHSGARLRDEGEPLIHGHVHDEYTSRLSAATGAVQVNVGVDRWFYFPAPATEVARVVAAALADPERAAR